MKNFLLDILPKIQLYSQKLDDLTLLTSQHWVFIDDDSDSKVVYLFRKNNELLISTNGAVEKAKWEYLGNQSILVDSGDKSYLYKHGFFDENLLALKVDSSAKFVIFVNENKFDGEVNSIKAIEQFINEKYIQPLLIQKTKQSDEVNQIVKKYIESMPFLMEGTKQFDKAEEPDKLEEKAKEEDTEWLVYSIFGVLVIFFLLILIAVLNN